MLTKYHESAYTRAVTDLINQICHPQEAIESLVKDAQDYFSVADQQKSALAELTEKRRELQLSLAQASSSGSKSINNTLTAIEKSIKAEQARQQEERLQRLNRALQVCNKLLDLSEGEDEKQTLLKSAKFLGTVLLLSPGQGKKLAELHQRLKPAYRAVLSLRLLDKLLGEGLIDNRYIHNHYDADSRYSLQEDKVEQPHTYMHRVMIPVILAAIFQDIGMQHPKAQEILTGQDGLKDPFQLLPSDERKKMLKINYEQTLDYLENGLGAQQYVGNSRDERDQFEQDCQQTLKFIHSILRDAIQPRLGIGDIIKIPQVYCSVVLSTKRDYKLSDLPKACLLITQLAEKNTINQRVAALFTNLVGHFPQGFGVAFIPFSDQGYELDRYEYAIVNRLNPADPHEPICRVVTRNLTYISSGSITTIDKNVNLYFSKNRKKLAKLDKQRLTEILMSLTHQYDPDNADSLIPASWQPYEYFSDKRNQNLWSKAY